MWLETINQKYVLVLAKYLYSKEIFEQLQCDFVQYWGLQIIFKLLLSL